MLGLLMIHLGGFEEWGCLSGSYFFDGRGSLLGFVTHIGVCGVGERLVRGSFGAR